MSIHNRPYEWAREMNRLLMNGNLNQGNYEQDVINAIVAVTDVHIKNDKLETDNERLECELAEMRGLVVDAVNGAVTAKWKVRAREVLG